ILWSLPVPFIPPMLCERLTDPARLSGLRHIAEPKLDGQRAQLHVAAGRAVACYSRRGEDLLRHAGMAWLRDIAWPFDAAVLDGEACAGDGHEGIQAVFSERRRPDGAMSLVFFDLLALDAGGGMRGPCRTAASDGRTSWSVWNSRARVSCPWRRTPPGFTRRGLEWAAKAWS